MDHVEPGNPKKAAVILRTDETIGMPRASESHSLLVKVIQRVASFQKGTVNIAFESSVSQKRVVQMIEWFSYGYVNKGWKKKSVHQQNERFSSVQVKVRVSK